MSRPQLLVLLGFALLVVVGVRLLADTYREPPRPLFAPPAETRPH